MHGLLLRTQRNAHRQHRDESRNRPAPSTAHHFRPRFLRLSIASQDSAFHANFLHAKRRKFLFRTFETPCRLRPKRSRSFRHRRPRPNIPLSIDRRPHRTKHRHQKPKVSPDGSARISRHAAGHEKIPFSKKGDSNDGRIRRRKPCVGDQYPRMRIIER